MTKIKKMNEKTKMKNLITQKKKGKRSHNKSSCVVTTYSFEKHVCNANNNIGYLIELIFNIS